MQECARLPQAATCHRRSFCASITSALKPTVFLRYPRGARSATASVLLCAGVDDLGAATTYTPLDESLISLRPEGTAPRPLADILGPSGKQDVQGFLDTCLAPKEEVPGKLRDSGGEAAVLDPGLKRSLNAAEA